MFKRSLQIKPATTAPDRIFRCQFNLKSLKYSNTATYYLVIADERGLQMPQREPFQIDIAFAVDEIDSLVNTAGGKERGAIYRGRKHS